MLAFLLACAPDPTRYRGYGVEDTGTPTTTTPGTINGCVPGMARVGDVCIDVVEASYEGELGNPDQGAGYPTGTTTGAATVRPGEAPATNITWYQAFGVCENAGKHLCRWEEWRDACDGESGAGGERFPWGSEPEPETVCALVNQDGTTGWDGLVPTGSLAGCRTDEGVFDQVGNAWEWVDLQAWHADGVPLAGKVGGAYYAGYANGACDEPAMTEHPPYFAGTIGFRCCVDPTGE